MTTIDISPDVAVETPPSALASWVTSADHKQIGRLFVGAGLLALLGALVVAVLVGVERIDAGGYQLLEDGAVIQLFSAYRVLMAFGVVAPLLIGLAVAIVPLQLGAKALALPRVAAAGFWTWLVGIGLTVASLVANGGPGGGNEDMVDLFLASMVLVALGLALAAGSVATSVLTTRAPGMGLTRVPMLSWSALAGSVALLATLPVMVGTTIYLYVDHRSARAAFGGNAGILEWMGWSLGQPHTYVLAIVAVGVLADVVPVMARVRQPKRPAVLVAIGLVTVSVLGAVTQLPARLPWVGDDFFDEAATNLADLLPYLLFYAVPAFGVLGVVALSLLALRSGRPRLSAPLVLGLLGVLLLLAGMGGQLLFAVDDAGLSGTVFEEGQFVFVTYGAVLAALGGVAYWGPKLWGRKLPDTPAILLALLGALGVVLAGGAYYIAGFADQPAVLLDGFDYSGPQEALNAIATVGQALVVLVVLAFVLLAVRSFAAGAPAGDDPWDGQTLEWATSSPPPDHNFAELPVVSSPEPLTDLRSSGSDA
jgi:cytochrome o ubiquinol oxidase subunit 1